MDIKEKPASSGSTESPKPGEVWWVAGQGPLRVVELPRLRKTSVTMETGDGARYWASLAQLLYQAKPAQIEAYAANCKRRNIPFTPFTGG